MQRQIIFVCSALHTQQKKVIPFTLKNYLFTGFNAIFDVLL